MENNTPINKYYMRITSVFHVVTTVSVLLPYPASLGVDLANIKDFKVIDDTLCLQLSDAYIVIYFACILSLYICTVCLIVCVSCLSQFRNLKLRHAS